MSDQHTLSMFVYIKRKAFEYTTHAHNSESEIQCVCVLYILQHFRECSVDDRL